MVYRSTEYYPDVWIKRETTDNDDAYYRYMLVYFGDMLHLANDSLEDMLSLDQVYQLKEGFGPPYIYLRANVDKVQLEDARTVWYMNFVEYICGPIKNVDSILEGNKATLKFFGNGHSPYP